MLYGTGGEVRAVSYSLETGGPTGDPFVVAQQARSPSVADDGTLVYVIGTPQRNQLSWYSRRGEKLAVVGPVRDRIVEPSISHDGRLIAASVTVGGNQDLWITDIRRGVQTRLTSQPRRDSRPIWSPDARRIVYTSRVEGAVNTYSIRADGSAEPVELVGGPDVSQPSDWSRDGKRILFHQRGAGLGNNVLYLERVGGDEYTEPASAGEADDDERVAKFSPNGRYIAYCSTANGKDEVYVRQFPGGEGRIQISRGNGGTQPRWSRDGSELYYVEYDTMMAVKVESDGEFSASPPEPLFRNDALIRGFPEQNYDVSADGRFLVVDSIVDEGTAATIQVVQNWYEEFRNREAGQ